MNISFEGQVALVTGAASGLGLARAKAFAESGASVVLADWNEKEVQAAAQELADKGRNTLGIRCDVSDDAEVEAMVKQTGAKLEGQDEELSAMLEKFVPMKRMGRAEEIADAVLWLCSSAASYVTGQSISVDGGYVMR